MSWAVRKALDLVRRGEWRGGARFLLWAVREQWHEHRLGVRTGGNADHSALGARPDECHEYEATSYSALAEVFRRVGPVAGHTRCCSTPAAASGVCWGSRPGCRTTR